MNTLVIGYMNTLVIGYMNTLLSDRLYEHSIER